MSKTPEIKYQKNFLKKLKLKKNPNPNQNPNSVQVEL